eukprot:1156717-Pelagomonas_calceolata.AAC.5
MPPWVPDINEWHGVKGLGWVRYGVQTVLGCLKLDVSGQHFHNIRIVVQPGHGRGGVHYVAQGLEHDFITVRRMAERVVTVAHRKGISARPKDLVMVTGAKISIAVTFKIKRVGEPFSGDLAPIMQG